MNLAKTQWILLRLELRGIAALMAVLTERTVGESCMVGLTLVESRC